MLERIGGGSLAAHRAILIGLCMLLFCIWLVRVPLVEVDETRYSEATREMRESGNYLIPHYNYEPRYQKPILFYWVLSGSTRLLGMNELALRLPSALFAIVLVLLLHAFLLRWLRRPSDNEDETQDYLFYAAIDAPLRPKIELDDLEIDLPRVPAGSRPEPLTQEAVPGTTILVQDLSNGVLPPQERRVRGAALLGAVALATMPVIALWARAAVTDLLLTLCISASVLALAQAELLTAADNRSRRNWYLLAAGCSGVAFLTKGPIGIILPLLTWVVYHLSQRSFRQALRRVPWVQVALVFCLVAVPWYAATWLVNGPGFMSQFFLTENMLRFTGGQHHELLSRLVSLVTYPLLVMAIFFPYSGFVLHELVAPASGRTTMNNDSLCRLRRFALAWLGAVLGFFTLSNIQYPNYVQSAAPAVAIIFTLHLLGQSGASISNPRRRLAHGLDVTSLLIFGVIFICGIVYLLLLPKAPGERLWIMPYPQPAATIMAIIVAICGTLLLHRIMPWTSPWNRLQRIGKIMVAWIALLVVGLLGVAPIVYRSLHLPSAQLGEYLRTLPPSPVVCYLPRFPENAIFYGRRKIDFFSSREPESRAQVLRTFGANNKTLLVTDKQGLQSLNLQNARVFRRFAYFIVVEIPPQP